MALELANTPVSWGVHYPEDPRNEPWQTVLDGIARAGYRSLSSVRSATCPRTLRSSELSSSAAS